MLGQLTGREYGALGMLIIKHAVNTIEELRATPAEYGIEVDIRAFGNELVLHHDPFVQGELFADFLIDYKHAFIILNIKCEGIEAKVIKLVEDRGIEDYFLLDVTTPFILKLIDQGVRKIAIRFSEMEAIETCFRFKGLVDWVFVDNITHLPVTDQAFIKLRQHYQLCIVSPELLHRSGIQETKMLLRSNPVDAVLTDEVGKWLPKPSG